MSSSRADHILAAVRAAADSRAIVELYGSSVYAPAHASDVDVLVSHDDATRLAATLGLTPIPTLPPRMHGTIDDISVDITVVNGDDDLAARMRAGPRDARALAAQLHDHGCDDTFQATWPHVRHFVRTRALGHNGLGWFGSFGWALLLAIPLVRNPELRNATSGTVVPAWIRWLSQLTIGTRIGFDGTHAGDPEPVFLVAPAPPVRDVARLSKRAMTWLLAEARAALAAIGDATDDATAMRRIRDLADDPPPGTTLVIAGTDEHTRGRYDGNARGLLRELETLGAVRSWGRFDDDGAGGWEHRITVPRPRTPAARELVERWLEQARIDASLS